MSLASREKINYGLGIGSASNTVALFSLLKSTTGRFDPSAFLTNKRGEEYGDIDGSITPNLNILSTSCSIVDTLAKGKGYGFTRIGLSVFILMTCSTREVLPGFSVKISLYSLSIESNATVCVDGSESHNRTSWIVSTPPPSNGPTSKEGSSSGSRIAAKAVVSCLGRRSVCFGSPSC